VIDEKIAPFFLLVFDWAGVFLPACEATRHSRPSPTHNLKFPLLKSFSLFSLLSFA